MRLQLIFLGWGLTGVLTFWSSLSSAVKFLGHSKEQGRFFGILDGGRGLVWALLASVVVLLFCVLSEPTDSSDIRVAPMIVMSSTAVTLFGVLVFFLVTDMPTSGADVLKSNQRRSLQVYFATIAVSGFAGAGFRMTFCRRNKAREL